MFTHARRIILVPITASLMLFSSLLVWLAAIDFAAKNLESGHVQEIVGMPPCDAPPPPPPDYGYHGDRLKLASESSVYPRLREENREAFLIVGNARAFARGGLGVPVGLAALRKLAADPLVADALRDILRRGEIGGQLYALCGLYYLDRRTFEFHLPWYRELTRVMLDTNDGCIGVRRSVAVIVMGIENGMYPRELLGGVLATTQAE